MTDRTAEQAELATEVRPRNFSPWFQVVTRLMATEESDPFPDDDPTAWDAWRGRFRARLDGLLAPWPTRVPFDVEVADEVWADGYRRSRLVFDSEATMSVPAYLLVPEGRAAPGSAVLAVHGHGPGKSRVCGLDPDARAGEDYATELARRGHLVLAPDLRCFGERADWNPPDHYGCDTNLVHQFMGGWTPLTQNLWDLARCLDVLSEHPLVDAARLGVVGFSYGATAALFLAAIDPRVTAAVVSGYFSSWAESHKVPWNMCGSQVLFGMLGKTEHTDLGALIAPRPLLVESGRDDLLFPVAAAEESVRRLSSVYEAASASDRLVHDVFEGEHEWHGALAYPFLDRWLAPGAPTP
jgi:dienelactone hydrolase